MMKIFMFMLFMIPLVSKWWLLSLGICVFVVNMFFQPLNFYYSNLSYSYGFDIISYWLLVLSFWIVFLMIMASFLIKKMNNYKNEFIFMNLFLLVMLVLSFSTSNFFLYYLYFESIIIPTLFLVFGWGYQPERLFAGFYLLFYTLMASLPLFMSLLWINKNGSLSYFMVDSFLNFYLYMGLIMAFLVSLPMMFFHFWLPKAHVEAPISGSMILAGVMLKLGGYGFYRVYIFMYKYSIYLNYFPIGISLLSLFMIGLLCLFQFDIKTLIAYSSVSHMGLVIGGILSLNVSGYYGSLLMMLGHGLCSSGLFCLANFIYERSNSRSLLINKGLITCFPLLSLFWFIFSVNNMSSPLSLNFFGEIFLINSLMSFSMISMPMLFMGAFLSCCYSIYFYCVTQHGAFSSFLNVSLFISFREYMLLLFHLFPLNLLFMKLDLFMLL
uniref:NADH-ubiquinone oxidoreductase chain 4 n=1 Tax=Pachyphlegyas modiglianii TaxID=2816051 RepID=A0A8T9ZX10_9HEMI|nr:NADH dehydrogenase subunit 4 [Pachyphlegyas modiglianii]